MTCSLQIIDIYASRMMIIAGAMIILGMIVPVPIGLGLYFLGWLLVGYNLTRTMPENDIVFWPAIVAIILSTFGIRLFSNGYVYYLSVGVYVVAWLVFGYNLGGHLPADDRILGIAAAVLAIISSAFIMHPYGAAFYTVSWGAISSIYSVPTLTTMTSDLLPCLVEFLPSNNQDLQCILTSNCFSDILTNTKGLTGKDYIDALINSINCAANTCENSGIFKTIANKLECYKAAGCLTPIENNPPTTPQALIGALFNLALCAPNC